MMSNDSIMSFQLVKQNWSPYLSMFEVSISCHIWCKTSASITTFLHNWFRFSPFFYLILSFSFSFVWLAALGRRGRECCKWGSIQHQPIQLQKLHIIFVQMILQRLLKLSLLWWLIWTRIGNSFYTWCPFCPSVSLAGCRNRFRIFNLINFEMPLSSLEFIGFVHFATHTESENIFDYFVNR